MTREGIEARHPRWSLTFEYGWWWATRDSYDASWEGEEDGWVDNGHRVSERDLETLEREIVAWEEEHA